MLEAWRNAKGEKPRLVHRLDRDTSGVLVVARTRLAAMKLAEAFRGRDAKKTYWALVRGVPKKREDKISTWLVKEPTPDGDRVRVARHGEEGADHAVSHYRVVEQAAQTLSWLEMEPHTGRTHQLRVHAAHIGCPIIGDPKYFEADQNWDFPGGMQNRLHLHARRIVIPHPDRGVIDVTAPLPPHMRQSWNLLGFDEASAGGTRNEHGRRHVRPARCDRRRGRRVHACAHLLVGAERRCGQARQCRLQPDLPDAGPLGDRRLAGVPVVPLSRHPAVRPPTERCRPGCSPASCSVRSSRCIFVGLEYTTVARSTLMVNTMPFWVLIGAHFLLGERMSLAKFGGLALAFAGVALVFSDKLSLPDPSAIIGDVLSLAGGMFWAATTLVIKTSRLATASAEKTAALPARRCRPSWQLPMLLFAGPVFRERLASAGRRACCSRRSTSSPSPMSLWFWLMRRYPAAGLSSFAFLTPVFGVLCGGLLLNEPLSIRIFLALALIGAGLIIVNRPQRQRA